MCRQTSVLNKIAFAIFVLGCLASALSFAAPFWIRTSYQMGILKQGDNGAYQGLWGSCCTDKDQPAGFVCTWVWYDYYAYKNNLPSCMWSNTYATINDLPSELIEKIYDARKSLGLGLHAIDIFTPPQHPPI